MFKLFRSVLRHYRQLAVIASLVFATLVCLGLFVLRAAHSHSFIYKGLLWNLVLAWIPMLTALVAYNLHKTKSLFNGVIIVSGMVLWIIFLPNAPYLITDLMHLQPYANVPFWYDLMLLAAFAATGLFLGLISLMLMQIIVRNTVGLVAGWLFVVGALGLSSFGVYLGRFLRWNSWDLFVNPLPVLADIGDRLLNPLAHSRTLAFSAVFAVFFLATYLMLSAMTSFKQEASVK